MFQHYYLKRTFLHALAVTESVTGPSIVQFWKNFNILDAINIIELAWKDVSSNCLNGCWKKLWVECTKNYEATENSTPEIQNADLNASDIQDLIESHNEGITNEELIAEEQILDDESDISSDNIETEISSEKIKEAFEYLDKAKEIFSEYDSNVKRKNQVNSGIESAIVCYRELYKQIKRPAIQVTLDTFFPTSGKTNSVEQARMGLSKPVSNKSQLVTLNKYFSAGKRKSADSVSHL